MLLPLFSEQPGGTDDHAAIALGAARRALELDSTLAEAHAALSQRAMVLTWDRATAEAEGRRAIELRPSYATGWQWYAEGLLAQGRMEEARAAMNGNVYLPLVLYGLAHGLAGEEGPEVAGRRPTPGRAR